MDGEEPDILFGPVKYALGLGMCHLNHLDMILNVDNVELEIQYCLQHLKHSIEEGKELHNLVTFQRQKMQHGMQKLGMNNG